MVVWIEPTGQWIVSLYTNYWYLFDMIFSLFIFLPIVKFSSLRLFGIKTDEAARDKKGDYKMATAFATGIGLVLAFSLVFFEIRAQKTLLDIWPILPPILGLFVGGMVYRNLSERDH